MPEFIRNNRLTQRLLGEGADRPTNPLDRNLIKLLFLLFYFNNLGALWDRSTVTGGERLGKHAEQHGKKRTNPCLLSIKTVTTKKNF